MPGGWVSLCVADSTNAPVLRPSVPAWDVAVPRDRTAKPAAAAPAAARGAKVKGGGYEPVPISGQFTLQDEVHTNRLRLREEVENRGALRAGRSHPPLGKVYSCSSSEMRISHVRGRSS